MNLIDTVATGTKQDKTTITIQIYQIFRDINVLERTFYKEENIHMVPSMVPVFDDLVFQLIYWQFQLLNLKSLLTRVFVIPLSENATIIGLANTAKFI